jgi:hypothetical protein
VDATPVKGANLDLKQINCPIYIGKTISALLKLIPDTLAN